VLVVDDEPMVREVLARYLAKEGYSVDTAEDGDSALRSFADDSPDIVLLDLMLPRIDGLEVFRRIRELGQTPVIMLTAKGEETDRVVGLELGADDYVGKPFDPRELVARIDAVLRRRGPVPGAPDPGADAFRFGDFELDLHLRRLRRADNTIALSSGEFALLHALVRHANRPLKRERLLELARGDDADINDRAIDVQVYRLRRLVEPDPARPRYIQTVWGVGYVFVPDGNGRPAAQERA